MASFNNFAYIRVLLAAYLLTFAHGKAIDHVHHGNHAALFNKRATNTEIDLPSLEAMMGLHRNLIAARGAMEERAGMIPVPESELHDLLSQIKSVEDQVNKLIASQSPEVTEELIVKNSPEPPPVASEPPVSNSEPSNPEADGSTDPTRELYSGIGGISKQNEVADNTENIEGQEANAPDQVEAVADQGEATTDHDQPSSDSGTELQTLVFTSTKSVTSTITQSEPQSAPSPLLPTGSALDSVAVAEEATDVSTANLATTEAEEELMTSSEPVAVASAPTTQQSPITPVSAPAPALETPPSGSRIPGARVSKPVEESAAPEEPSLPLANAAAPGLSSGFQTVTLPGTAGRGMATF